MKSNKKPLHELSPHIPQKTPKRNISCSTNEMSHTDITIKAQRTTVNGTHAMEATNCHQNSQAINQLSRYRRQPAHILQCEGIVVMDRLNRRRDAQQSKSAEVRINSAKAAREWETSTYTRNIGIRASTCNRYINSKMTVRSHEV
jgi:hypothetical protein